MAKRQKRSFKLRFKLPTPIAKRVQAVQSGCTTVADAGAQHPILLWGGLTTCMTLLACLSVSSLMSPGVLLEKTPGGLDSGDVSAKVGSSNASAMIAPQQGGQVAMQSRSRMPLWLFGAIALTCGSGCIVLSRQMTRAKPMRRRKSGRKLTPAQFTKNSQSALSPSAQPTPPTPQPTVSPSPTRLPASSPASANRVPPALPPAPPRKSQKTLKSQKESQKVQKPQKARKPPLKRLQPLPDPSLANPLPRTVTVTVVPTNESHPLDWGEATFLDSVDVRKQRSVASWL